MSKSLIPRIITGALFIVSVVVSVSVSPWLFMILFGFFTVVGIMEFYKISGSLGFKPQRFLGILIGVVTFLMFFLNSGKYIDSKWLYILPTIIIVVPIIELFRKQKTPTSDWAQTLLAPIYIALPFGILSNLIYLPSDHSFSGKILLGFFVFVWISDTGAYVTGSMFGKHKLFERISPKKTIEGLIGGILFALVAAWPVSILAGEFTLWQWLLISFVAVSFGTLGDLVESMLKRNADIKDSGKILPGHGGVLDRFDSALLACPPVWLIICIMTNN